MPELRRNFRAGVIRFLKVSAALFFVAANLVAHAGGGVGVADLRCEYRIDPLGIDATQPRLSWILRSARPGERGQAQSAYRIVAASSSELLNSDKGDLWDSGKMESSQSIHVRYAGRPLASRQFVWWKVKVWDEKGRASAWSNPARWSMGLLRTSDWEAKWIGLEGGDGLSEELSGARWIWSADDGGQSLWFRRTFEISATNSASHALLVVASSSGELIPYVNGVQVLPVFGSFPRGYSAQTVSGMLHPGRNVLAVKVTADTGSSSGNRGIIAGITLDLADGRVEHIQTDNRWKVSTKEEADWSRSEFDSTHWTDATVIPNKPIPNISAERTRLPARMLRKEFSLSDVPSRAMLYVSGLGYSESYINGEKVGNDVLAPALSDYDKREFYLTYDVTRLLRRGGNALGVLLGNGRFYAPRLSIPVLTRTFGYPELRFQLEIQYKDGKRVTVSSDQSWKITADGPIRANNDYDGEEYDARKEQSGWALPGFNDRKWTAAQQVRPPSGTLRAQMIAPMRVMHDVVPVRITQPEPGVYVFDMGQNIVGWCRMHISGRAGTRITLRHAERLQSNGMLYTDNLRSARQIDTYILNGKGSEVFEPRFISNGFRYVEIRGLPGRPPLSLLTGRVVYDALEENSNFATSNKVINKVYRNLLWSDRGNYHSIPTDCPQRDERQGWLGDRSAESKGESFAFNVEQFYEKWLQDIDDSMDAEGRINDVAPAYWTFYNENVVWPASFFIVANMLHEQYGDDTAIQEHYPAMRRWVMHMRPLMQNSLMPVDKYGDWCVPPKSLNEIFSNDPGTKTAPEVLGTTYFYAILRLMSQFASISGHSQDQHEYDELASRMRTAFNGALFRPESHQYSNGTQTSSILPLALGLAPDDEKQAIADALIRKIENDSHVAVGSGLVGMQFLMRTVTEYGRADLAYQIASRTQYPSWGYMAGRGATTVWELWNGDTANPAMNSGNHLMLMGDFASWMYEDLAGIASDARNPGYKHIIVNPHVVDGLEFVQASYLSPYGQITSHWQRSGDVFTLRVIVPLNTTATIHIPTNDVASIHESRKSAQTSSGVRFVLSGEGFAEYEVGSGQYVFVSKITPQAKKSN